MKVAFIILAAVFLAISSRAVSGSDFEFLNGPEIIKRVNPSTKAEYTVCVARLGFGNGVYKIRFASLDEASEKCPTTKESYGTKGDVPNRAASGSFNGAKSKSDGISIDSKEWKYYDEEPTVLFRRIGKIWDAVCALTVKPGAKKEVQDKDLSLMVCEKDLPSGFIDNFEREKDSVKCPHIEECAKKLVLAPATKGGGTPHAVSSTGSAGASSPIIHKKPDPNTGAETSEESERAVTK